MFSCSNSVYCSKEFEHPLKPRIFLYTRRHKTIPSTLRQVTSKRLARAIYLQRVCCNINFSLQVHNVSLLQNSSTSFFLSEGHQSFVPGFHKINKSTSIILGAFTDKCNKLCKTLQAYWDSLSFFFP